jgi:hypothetical protein
MAVDESQVPQGFRDTPPEALQAMIASGYPLRERFNSLAGKLGLTPTAASKRFDVRTADDLPRAIAEIQAELEEGQ